MKIVSKILALSIALTVTGTCPEAFAQKPDNTKLTLSTVVIDAGHGGKDPGCISLDNKTQEKDIVLDIAKRLSSKIKEGYPRMKVIMTRSTDKFVELNERAGIANRNKANLFISIHVNSVEGKRTGPNGYSVHILGQFTSKNKDLYAGNMNVVQRENSVITLEDDYSTKYEGFDPSNPESYIFMNLMQNAFLEQSFKFAQDVDQAMKGGAIAASRGISQDPILVLWKTAMPAVLVECGYMSNPNDRAAIRTEKGRDKIADDIYEAFKKYKKDYDGSVAIESASKPEKEAETEEGTVKETAAGQTEKTEKEGTPVTGECIYGTQVLASSKDMSEDDPFFKGEKVTKVLSGRLYKYVLGASSDLAEAKAKQKTVRQKFPDSFLVKVENGEVSIVR